MPQRLEDQRLRWERRIERAAVELFEVITLRNARYAELVATLVNSLT